MAESLIQVTGFPELLEKIKQLSNDKDKKREITAILKQVALDTVRVARQEAPVSKKTHRARGKVISPGNLKKSIGTMVGKKGDARSNPTVYVGPRAKGSLDGWYGHFVEYGINVYNTGFKRKRKKGANDGAAVRRTKANPFMQRAYQKTGGKALAESQQRLTNFIQRRIDKLSNS